MDVLGPELDASTIMSGLAVGVSLFTWKKSREFDDRRMAMEERWRKEDLRRDKEKHQPNIRVEQNIGWGKVQGLETDLTYLRVVAKNFGQVPVVLNQMATIRLTTADVPLEDYSEHADFIGMMRGDDPNWLSPERFPYRLNPNESCETYIDIESIYSYMDMLNQVRPDGKFIAYFGQYEDRVGRTYRPSRPMVRS